MRNVLTNFNLFIDAIGMLGEVLEYTPPSLTITTEDFRGAGMDSAVPIDMGMEPLEATFALGSYNPVAFKAWGRLPASTRLKAKGALTGLDGAVSQVVDTMSGKIVGLEPGAWALGTRNNNTFTVRPTYFRRELGGEVIHEIDVPNGVRVVNGVDQMAAIREVIGG